MAIYHLHVKVIGRKAVSSAVASAAYRSASQLHDDRLDRSPDFSNKRGVVYSEVMLPQEAPESWSDREQIWNDIEAFEVRPVERAGDALAHVTAGAIWGSWSAMPGRGRVRCSAWRATLGKRRGTRSGRGAVRDRRQNLESGSSIASRTIASMERGWEKGRDVLTARTVLVIDEVGMVGASPQSKRRELAR
jgi:hypothetical protein